MGVSVVIVGPGLALLPGEISVGAAGTAAVTVKYKSLLQALVPELLVAFMSHRYLTPTCSCPEGMISELELPGIDLLS